MPFSKEINLSRISFTPGKEPTVDQQGRILFVRAPELQYEWSKESWQLKNIEMNGRIDRKDCQVVILSPYFDDVTHILYRSLRSNQLGKYPVGRNIEQEFPDRELDIFFDSEAASAQSVYVVASLLTERDFSRVAATADHFRNTLKAKFVTLVCPFLGYARKDKNVTRTGEYEPSATGARSKIGEIALFVDRIIAIEPHSSASQACAAMFEIPFAPISPWKMMIQELSKRITIDPCNTVVVRPDKGRNIAANRIRDYLKIPSVSFDKVRISGSTVEIFQLSKEEQKMVEGKNLVSYDDEGASMGTLTAVADTSQSYGAKSLAVCLVHCKFTPGWETKIKHRLFSTILGTDSRQSIGNIGFADNIQIISLEPLIRQLIEADINGVNFWTDPQFKEMILQEE